MAPKINTLPCFQYGELDTEGKKGRNTAHVLHTVLLCCGESKKQSTSLHFRQQSFSRGCPDYLGSPLNAHRTKPTERQYRPHNPLPAPDRERRQYAPPRRTGFQAHRSRPVDSQHPGDGHSAPTRPFALPDLRRRRSIDQSAVCARCASTLERTSGRKVSPIERCRCAPMAIVPHRAEVFGRSVLRFAIGGRVLKH